MDLIYSRSTRLFRYSKTFIYVFLTVNIQSWLTVLRYRLFRVHTSLLGNGQEEPINERKSDICVRAVSSLKLPRYGSLCVKSTYNSNYVIHWGETISKDG